MKRVLSFLLVLAMLCSFGMAFAAEEAPAEEPAAEEEIAEAVPEEPAAVEEPAEEPVEEPAEPEAAEPAAEPVEDPAAVEEAPAEETAAEEAPADEQAEEIAEEPVADGVTTITTGSYTAYISSGGDSAYYYFTPTVTGIYRIYSTGSYDTYVTLYNSSGSQLDYNDDSDSGRNFSLSYDMTAGVTYEYAVRFYSSSQTGSIPFTLECTDVLSGTRSGTCGDSLDWNLDTSTGVLTISGWGEMYGYNWNSTPWRSYRSLIKTVIIESGVTSIGGYAFYLCTALTSVSIPDGVTEIGYDAFYNCSALTGVTIPDSVTSIGNYAFNGCSALTDIYYGGTWTQWAKLFGTLSGCTIHCSDKIIDKSGTYGDNVTWSLNTSTGVLTISGTGTMNGGDTGGDTGGSYRNNAPWVSYYSYVKTVVIESGITSIGHDAFSGCSGLTSITIPDSVTSISYRAFYDCSGLTSITIPDSVTSIDGAAFSGCSALTSVSIGSGVTFIGEWAFFNCTSLTGVYISDISKWCSISFENHFYNYGSNYSNPLYYAHNLYLNGNLVTDLTIPDGVTSIDNSAFLGCSALTSVSIPDSVTSIGSYAFYGCSALTSVSIPDSVTSIDNSAFLGCSALTSVSIGSGVTSIGYEAFCGCTALTDVYISDIVKWCNISFVYDYYLEDLSSNPLYYADNLYLNGNLVTDLTIPSGVTCISRYAFYGCTGLTSVTIPSGVTEISAGAFAGCSSLTSVTIPSSVKTIGDIAFYGCISLKEINLPSSLNSIGKYAFAGCAETAVDVPVSVTSIGDGAFCVYTKKVDSGTANLTDITINNTACTIGDMLTDANVTVHGYIGSTAQAYAASNGFDFECIVHMHANNDTGTVTKQPTCAAEGERTYTCAYCGHSYTEAIPATGSHTYDAGVVTKQPTTTAEGVKTFTCTVCGHTFTEQIAKLVITHSGTGWEKDSSTGSWYYFTNSVMTTNQWVKYNGSWYYFGTDGVMYTGVQSVDGKTYDFASSGKMLSGWQKIDNVWYYFGSAMYTNQWLSYNGSWYYFGSDGRMYTGKQPVGGKTYDFSSSGKMLSGWQKIDNVWYYFGSAMYTNAWLKYNGSWYYFGSDGKMYTGVQAVDGKTYDFSSGGKMLTGWQKIDNIWYYFGSAMYKSQWLQSGSTWYYFNADGSMATGTVTTANGTVHTFASNGKWLGAA